MRYDTLPTLETEHLILRHITLKDVSDIFHYAKDPEVSKLLAWKPSTSIEKTRKVIIQWIDNYKKNKKAPWGIVDKTIGNIIGTIEVRHYDPILHRVVLGYCLSQDYWGKGLMVEAIKCIVQYIFLKTDITKIAATCRVDNFRSQRVLEKAGFYKNICSVEFIFMKGKWVDLDEWEIKK